LHEQYWVRGQNGAAWHCTSWAKRQRTHQIGSFKALHGNAWHRIA
jgi:hypothetical protein